MCKFRLKRQNAYLLPLEHPIDDLHGSLVGLSEGDEGSEIDVTEYLMQQLYR